MSTLKPLTDNEFRALTARIRPISQTDYGCGYHRGLQVRRHGERYGTPEERELWESWGQNGNHHVELGRGYRDAVAGREPAAIEGRVNEDRTAHYDWLTEPSRKAAVFAAAKRAGMPASRFIDNAVDTALGDS